MYTDRQRLKVCRLRAKGPFKGAEGKKYPGGRYVKDGLDLSLTEVWERLNKPGFEQLTEDCKDSLAKPTPWKRSDVESIIKQLNLERAIERNMIVCPRCKFPRVK